MRPQSTSVYGQAVALQHNLERAPLALVSVLGAAHVEGVPIQAGPIPGCIGRLTNEANEEIRPTRQSRSGVADVKPRL